MNLEPQQIFQLVSLLAVLALFLFGATARPAAIRRRTALRH